MRPAFRAGPCPSAIPNKEFFPKQRDLGSRLVKLGVKPLAADGATTGDGHDDTGQRDGVQDPDLTWRGHCLGRRIGGRAAMVGSE